MFGVSIGEVATVLIIGIFVAKKGDAKLVIDLYNNAKQWLLTLNNQVKCNQFVEELHDTLTEARKKRSPDSINKPGKK